MLDVFQKSHFWLIVVRLLVVVAAAAGTEFIIAFVTVEWISLHVALCFIVPFFFLLLFFDLVEIGKPQRAAEDNLNRASAQHAPVLIEERRDLLINLMDEFDRQRVQDNVDSRGRVENHHDIERVKQSDVSWRGGGGAIVGEVRSTRARACDETIQNRR